VQRQPLRYFWDFAHPTSDLGVITPSAALASFPYAPEHCLRALRHFHGQPSDRIWGEYGFMDAFQHPRWYASRYLAIDQGPIVMMIESFRSGLLRNLFTSCPEI
jgi:hypothetical protein